MQVSYHCKPKLELLELDCLEMDGTLRFLANNFASSGKITLVNPQQKSLDCKVDIEENIISARGLQKFIKSLKKPSFYISPQGDTFYLSLENQRPPLFPLETSDTPGIRVVQSEEKEPFPQELPDSAVKSIDDYYLHRQGLRFAVSPGFDTLLSLNVVRNVDFYEYQMKTVRHVLQHMRGRALLCDEVGLGKTVEAGLIMMEYIMRGLVKKVLVLTPSSLVEQWQEELQSKFNLDFEAADSSRFKKSDNGWQQFDRVVASLDKAKRQGSREVVTGEEYDLVIVDEAHRLKNRKTQAFKLVNELKKRYILLLTATPVANDLEELFNLITLLSPGQLDTAKNFRQRFISRGDRLKPRNTLDLKSMIKDVMVRNRRSQTDSILTRRYAETMEIELTPSEKTLYQTVTTLVRGYFRQTGNPGINQFMLKTLQREVGSSSRAIVPTLEKMSANDSNPPELRSMLAETAKRAKSIKNNAKAEALVKLLSSRKEKAIIFTGFQQTRAFLVDFLQNQGFDVVTFHGSMRRAEKEAAIREFRDTARLLVSTESGGEGRNLQFCNVMINYDLPWNPMRIEQRIGRIHRVGQQNDVYIYNLSAKDTVEAKILELLDSKINMFQLVVGELDMILGNLKEQRDFEELLLDIWTGSPDEDTLTQRLEELGDRLVSAKEEYEQVKQLDENLLGELLPDDD